MAGEKIVIESHLEFLDDGDICGHFRSLGGAVGISFLNFIGFGSSMAVVAVVVGADIGIGATVGCHSTRSARFSMVRCLSDCQRTSHSPDVCAMITPVSFCLSPVGVVTKVPITTSDGCNGVLGVLTAGEGVAGAGCVELNQSKRRLTASPRRRWVGAFVGVAGATGELNMS